MSRAKIGAAAERGRERYDDRDRMVNEGRIGTGVQCGPIHTDWGPHWALQVCTVCSASWLGIVDDWGLGDPCSWCERRVERIREEQTELDQWRGGGRDVA